MQSGELNKRILIGNTIEGQTPNGYPTTELDESTAIKVWAKIMGISNKQFYADNTENMEGILNFKIRYRPNFDTSMKVKYNNVIYDIIDTDDYLQQHRFLILRARMVRNNG
jgi:SPP1 family predicted phage head-tail adaptor